MKIILYCLLIPLLITGCEVDNYEAPSLTLTGRIVDSQTGELVESGGVNAGSLVKLYQDNSSQPLILKTFPDGTFTNTRLFAGNYSYVAEGAFEMATANPPPLVVDKDMTLEIEVIPHVRVKTELTEVGETSARVRLSFQTLPADKDLTQVAVMWSTYPNPNNFTFEGGGIQVENIESPDLSEGEREFQIEGLEPGTKYYLRGSALAVNEGNYYNYSPQLELETK
ncbi:MAG TPA: DUF3823 domain-containing protein [Anseongella sp.]|nr:DUF3823 domain-containing protein [Anseongella sp.]